MPFIEPSASGVRYALIAYDAAGNERLDDPDGKMSERIIEKARNDAISDVFIMCHGWKGDVPAAQEQFDAWVGAMAECEVDRQRARRRPDYQPLVVGLHWPSLPWGDEDFGQAGISFGAGPPIETWVDTFAQRIVGTPPARAALRTIFASAQLNPKPEHLPGEVRSAYQTLAAEAGLASLGNSAPSEEIGESFDPEDRYQLGRQMAAVSFGAPDLAGDLLSPLRQLSFWKMKDRARRFGESGAHALLRSLLAAGNGVRLHLMGHSFGCIAMAAAVAGPQGGAGLSAPAQSLVLVQGALSLWTCCADIPFRRGTPGYFRGVAAAGLIAGPIVTTRSTFDTAVGRWYPLGAGVAGQIAFDLASLPKYGGVGTFGLRGPGLDLTDLDIQGVDAPYAFAGGGKIYNLECSSVIRNGGGASGAHCDIAHPEVAHAVWSAALA